MSDNKDLLVDYQPLEYDKEVIKESIDKDDGPLVVEGTLQRADAKNQNGRVYPKDVLKDEAERYMKEKVNKNNALGELDHPDCLKKHSAQALTVDGFKYISNVEVGESIVTINPDTGDVEIEEVQEVIDEEYSGPMYQISSGRMDIQVTPNHRFLLLPRKDYPDRDPYWVNAEELYENRTSHSKSRIPKEIWGGWNGKSNVNGTSKPLHENFAFPSIDSDVFFKFIGIWLADGDTVTDRNVVQLHQVKEESTQEIRTLLSKFPNDLTWSEENKENGFGNTKTIFRTRNSELYSYLRDNFGEDCYSKEIPADVKNAPPEKIKNLLDWFVKGDGTEFETQRSDTRRRFFSTSEKLVDDLQEIALKLGHNGSIQEFDPMNDAPIGDRKIKSENKEKLYIYEFLKNDGYGLDKRCSDIKRFNFDGRVTCLSVPNGTFYAKDENGACFWTGNSSVVNLKNVSHNVIDMEWDGNDLNGKLEILDTPSGEILQDLLEAGIRLGISSRGLGSVSKRRDGAVEVQDDYSIVCFDMVSSPSTHGAFIEPINEAVDRRRVEEAQKWHSVDRMAQEIVGELSEKYSV